MTAGNADRQLHVFSTFMGMPPDTDTPPVCGATLTREYNGQNAPHCAECERILAEHRARVAQLQGGA